MQLSIHNFTPFLSFYPFLSLPFSPFQFICKPSIFLKSEFSFSRCFPQRLFLILQHTFFSLSSEISPSYQFCLTLMLCDRCSSFLCISHVCITPLPSPLSLLFRLSTPLSLCALYFSLPFLPSLTSLPPFFGYHCLTVLEIYVVVMKAYESHYYSLSDPHHVFPVF